MNYEQKLIRRLHETYNSHRFLLKGQSHELRMCGPKHSAAYFKIDSNKKKFKIDSAEKEAMAVNKGTRVAINNF